MQDYAPPPPARRPSPGSATSERKDRKRLPRLYAAAGVPELWLADCRTDLALEIHSIGRAGYEQQPADPEGSSRSPLLDRSVRLIRRRNELSRWIYDLESRG